MSEYDLSEIRIKDGDFEITVRTSSYTKNKGVQQTIMAPQTIPVQSASAIAHDKSPAVAEPAVPTAANASDNTSNLLEIKSPIVGTFYRSSGPDKPPFVAIGDKISEGSVVCIVEAMKLFNEIESEVSGKIVKVMVDDASPVEYDQVLFLVDPNG